MTIGLCGAHRTGKTTLAKAFAERAGIPFVQTSTSRVFADMGLDPAIDYPMDVRLDVQDRILFVLREQWRAMNGQKFITDRTPIDMIAYTLADVRQSTLTPEQDQRLKRYMDDCFNATNEFFSTLIVVMPGIPVTAAPGKASLSPGYIAHHAHLVAGLVVSPSVHAQHFYIPPSMTDLDRRVEAVERALLRSEKKHSLMLQAATEAGQPIVFH